MERPLTKFQALAIEKIKKSQARNINTQPSRNSTVNKITKATSRRVAKASSRPAAKKVRALKKTKASEPFFPITRPSFYGNNKPAEAQTKGNFLKEVVSTYQRVETLQKVKYRRSEKFILKQFKFEFIETK